MADTHGFEIVIEAVEEVVRKALRGAWKSAECPVEPGDEGRVPEFLDIPEDTGPVGFGDYEAEDGHIQIPQDELDANLVADVGAELTFGLHIQLDIQDPPLDSLNLIDMTADVRATAPIGTLPGSQDVGLLLDGLPRGNVNAALTSGHPIDANVEDLLKEYVDKAYTNGAPEGPSDPNFPTIPHTFAEEDHSWMGLSTVDVYAEVFDDNSDANYAIEVGLDGGTALEISIPIYLRMYNIELEPLVQWVITEGLEDPMGIETRLRISAPFESPPGAYIADMGSATVTVDPIRAASATITGSTEEGDNYVTNKARIPFMDLDTLISDQLKTRGEQMADDMGDPDTGEIRIEVPTLEQIEISIGDVFHEELTSRGYIAVWTPEATDETFEVNDVTVKVLADALVIALNAGAGADVNAMTSFMPDDREFAIAVSAETLNGIIDDTLDENSYSALPKRFHEEGKDVDLNSLDIALASDAIRMEGEVTVFDAIAGSIDVDADFTVDVGLTWVDQDGTQRIEPDAEEPDVSMATWAWVVSIIIGAITLGLVGVIIATVVVLIAEGIATSVGGSLVRDELTGALQGIGGWPENLSRIGRVRARFENPITIDSSGLVMAGTIEVISSCEDTAVVAADSGAAYTVDAATALLLAAANTHADASYRWRAGDGTAEAISQDVLHTYAASGLYIAKHALTINQVGGATSRHFALVQARNVPPTVDAGPDRTVSEGEVVILVGRFWDVEYPDTHESSWIFGDQQPPQAGTIDETNNPPQAVGRSTVQHAWCDNGEYIVVLRVRDQDGGMTTDTLKVTVLNVPPEVDAGPEMYAYRCAVLTLVGRFKDPGWCDTHVGSWDFGDCSPPQTAIIHETNEPPAADGVVVASHVYNRCGVYHVRCTVIDDDGGVGEATTVVRVVEVKNPGFEEGFRERLQGAVANHWQPYTARLQAETPPEQPIPTHLDPGLVGMAEAERVFACEQCLVHGGQRSQRMRLGGGVRAGIYQRVGANPGWDYQVSAWYAVHERTASTARLGIDPEGGSDPDAPRVVWSEGRESQNWAQLVGRVTARGGARAITIFLEAESKAEATADVCFDDVSLLPIQPFCPEEAAPPEPEEPAPEAVCVDFVELKAGSKLSTVYEKGGFTFRSLDKMPLEIAGWGVPVGKSKLLLRAGGLVVSLPFAADRVTVRVAYYTGTPVEVVAVDEQGNTVASATTPEGQDTLHMLELAGPGIVSLAVRGGGGEALLFQVCAMREGVPGLTALSDASIARLNLVGFPPRRAPSEARKPRGVTGKR